MVFGARNVFPSPQTRCQVSDHAAVARLRVAHEQGWKSQPDIAFGFLREEREEKDPAEELDRDHYERLERPGNIMGEGGGAGNGQSRVEKMRCTDVKPCT